MSVLGNRKQKRCISTCRVNPRHSTNFCPEQICGSVSRVAVL